MSDPERVDFRPIVTELRRRASKNEQARVDAIRRLRRCYDVIVIAASTSPNAEADVGRGLAELENALHHAQAVWSPRLRDRRPTPAEPSPP